jgi:hypothetical protein
MLKNYGHADIFYGTYSARDVSQPALDWMINHRMLVGWGGIRSGNKWNWGKATIFINATAINSEIDGIRVAWNIVDHRIFRSMESFRGESELGNINIIITEMRSCKRAQNLLPRLFSLECD